MNNDCITFERVLTCMFYLADGDLQTHLPASDWGFDGNGKWRALILAHLPAPTSGWPIRSSRRAARGNVSAYTNLGRKPTDQIAKSTPLKAWIRPQAGEPRFENGQRLHA